MSDPATLTSAASPSVDEGPVAEPFGHPTDTFDDVMTIDLGNRRVDVGVDRALFRMRFLSEGGERALTGAELIEGSRVIAEERGG